jgi:alkylation response protein AidB-like acyl-CoA dehydrogenase
MELGFGAACDSFRAEVRVFIGKHWPTADGNLMYPGNGLVVPALLEWGTEEQKQRFISPTLRSDIVWGIG